MESSGGGHQIFQLEIVAELVQVIFKINRLIIQHKLPLDISEFFACGYSHNFPVHTSQ